MNIDSRSSPMTEVKNLLDEQWPCKPGSRTAKTRSVSLEESNDEFPMHLVMLRADYITRLCKTDVTPIGHCKLMRVAGKTELVYVDDFVIAKVNKMISIKKYRFAQLFRIIYLSQL
jgi:hypothetical protein